MFDHNHRAPRPDGVCSLYVLDRKQASVQFGFVDKFPFCSCYVDV